MDPNDVNAFDEDEYERDDYIWYEHCSCSCDFAMSPDLPTMYHYPTLPDVLIKLDLRPEERSMDNICQFDVYWIVRQVIKVLEVIEVEAKDIKFEDIAAIGIIDLRSDNIDIWRKTLRDLCNIRKLAKRMEEKVKPNLQKHLKPLLKLPDLAVVKILESIVDLSPSVNDLETVKFDEEQHDHYRSILLQVYDYFRWVCNLITVGLEHNGGIHGENNGCKCHLLSLVEHTNRHLNHGENWMRFNHVEWREKEKWKRYNNLEWKEYFGFEEKSLADIWEEEVENIFGELFVEQI